MLDVHEGLVSSGECRRLRQVVRPVVKGEDSSLVGENGGEGEAAAHELYDQHPFVSRRAARHCFILWSERRRQVALWSALARLSFPLQSHTLPRTHRPFILQNPHLPSLTSLFRPNSSQLYFESPELEGSQPHDGIAHSDPAAKSTSSICRHRL